MAYSGPTADIVTPAEPDVALLVPSSHNVETQRYVGDPVTTPLASKNRRRSSLKTPGLLKRAVSSPNVRGLAFGDNMSISSSEKKRNKLGYHRTAVACGHCRKRKIRCIAAYEDATGRCQNCIRLKKDCHFFPVDQQGQPQGRTTRSGSKTETTGNDPDTSVSSSSPGALGSSSLEQIKTVNGQIQTPPLSQQSSFQKFQSASSGADQTDFHNPREPGYQQSFDHPQHFAHQQTSPHAHGDHRELYESHHSQYYSGNEQQALQGSYNNSPYGSTPLSGSMTTSPQASAFQFHQTSPASDSFSWAPQPPPRAMSIADTEDLHNAYTAHRSNTFPSIARRMSTAQEMMQVQQTGGHMMHPDAVHQAVMSPYHDLNNYQPVHHGMGWSSNMPPPALRAPPAVSEAYGQVWYPQSQSGLPNVQEEDHQFMYHPPSQHHQTFRPNPG